MLALSRLARFQAVRPMPAMLGRLRVGVQRQQRQRFMACARTQKSLLFGNSSLISRTQGTHIRRHCCLLVRQGGGFQRLFTFPYIEMQRRTTFLFDMPY